MNKFTIAKLREQYSVEEKFFGLWFNCTEYQKQKHGDCIVLLNKRLGIDIDSFQNDTLDELINLLYKRSDSFKKEFPFKVNYLVSFIISILVLAISSVSAVFGLKDESGGKLRLLGLLLVLILVLGYFFMLLRGETLRRLNSKSYGYKQIAEFFEEIKLNKVINKKTQNTNLPNNQSEDS